MSLEKQVGILEPEQYGKGIIKLVEDGIVFSRRGYPFQNRKEDFIAFSDISRILWGNVDPHRTPIIKSQEQKQHGLLVLRKLEKGPASPIAFTTGKETSEWVEHIKSFSPGTEFEHVIRSHKYACRVVDYELNDHLEKPYAKVKRDEKGTVFLTDRSITFCRMDISAYFGIGRGIMPTHLGCVSLLWEDIESLVVPRVHIVMPDERFHDFVDRHAGEFGGFLIRLVEIVVTFPFKLLMAIRGSMFIEDFFSKRGAFIVKTIEGNQPDLMFLQVSNVRLCLSLVHSSLKNK